MLKAEDIVPDENSNNNSVLSSVNQKNQDSFAEHIEELQEKFKERKEKDLVIID